MMLHVHRLAGCRPEPLAHYLKALGILRLVAAQADPQARAWWRDETFHLACALARDELEEFFLRRYAPTPFIDPWNGGSGFFPKDNRKGLEALERSRAQRFQAYRDAIVAGQQMTHGLKGKPDKTQKPLILQGASLAWRGTLRQWFDSAVVLDHRNEPAYPSLLGTGGNDGRLDFTNNAMQRIGELFDLADPQAPPRENTQSLLACALWDTPVPWMAAKTAIGQFLPGGAGGANATTGPEGDSLINPWDYLLMLEGGVLLQARATRRLNSAAGAQAGAPFALYAHAAGFASPGAEKSARGEQWLPLWSTPCMLEEIQSLFGEARLQVGKQTANRPVDAARALARLGTARGIQGFTRFGYLERNGQANLAVPLSRIRVRQQPQSRLIDDLAPWMDRLQRAARDRNAPNHFLHAERRLADAVFAALSHDPTPSRWQAVWLAAVAVEALQVRGTGFAAGPIPTLRTGWIAACADGSPEWRLALALGSAAASYHGSLPVDPVRRHWLPLNRRGGFDTTDSGRRLAPHSDVIMQGRDTIGDAIALVQRRLVEAAGGASRRLPLNAAGGCAAQPADLAAFLDGRTDDLRLSALARAAMAIDWKRWHGVPPPSSPTEGARPDAAWWALRLACLPWSLDENRSIPVDPALVRLCAAGHGPDAVTVALRRLRAHGVHAAFAGGIPGPGQSRRWAAALAFPVSRQVATWAAGVLAPAVRVDGGV